MESLEIALSKKKSIPAIIRSYAVRGEGSYTYLDIKFSQKVTVKLFEINENTNRTVLDFYPAPNHSQPALKSRIGEWPDRTRIVIEAEVELTSELLSDQIGQSFKLRFAEIDAAQLNASLAALVRSTEHSYLTQITINNKKSSSIRSEAVFKFNKNVSLKTFKLQPNKQYKYRFVLDFFYLSENTYIAKTVKKPIPTEKKLSTSPQKTEESLNTDQIMLSEVWLDVKLNRQEPAETALVLKDTSDGLWIPQYLLDKWGVTVKTNVKSRSHLNEIYFKLSDLGISSITDMSTLSAELTAPAGLLRPSQRSANGNQFIPLTPSPLGGFLNYDITATHSEFDSETSSAGLFEIGAFNGWGSGTSTALVRQYQEDDGYDVIRLNTTWRKDDPTNMRSLVIGDSITKSTAWSGAARFGGIQWGSNFSTRPEYITSPLLSVSDAAALPSTVDVYVNDALRFRDEIPSGPFSIDNIPAVTGPGETRVVIRDILGRERVLTQNFYSSSVLLREGLDEYSFEAGLLRESFSRESNDYAAPVAAATWRRGITNSFTLESHTHVSKNSNAGKELMAGLGAAFTIPFGGVATTAVAVSESSVGFGSFSRLGLQRQGEIINFGMTSDYATENYQQFGNNFNSLRSRGRTNGYIGGSIGKYGSISLGYTKQSYWNHDPIRFGTANYSLGLGRFGQFILSALHFVDGDNTVIQAMFTLPLSPGFTASSSVSKSNSNNQGTVHLQKNLPIGEGVGYRLTAQNGVSEQYKANVSFQTKTGLWSAEAVNQEGSNSYRGSVSGGLAVLGDNIHASRSIDNSFGIVRLDGFEGVRIYAENLEIAKTDETGYALIPRLRAYETNKIRIEQSDLPLDAHISATELKIAPYFRSGIFIDFPVERRRSAFFKIIDQHGEPLPLGAVIRTASGKLFPVGYYGEVFVSPLEESKAMTGISKDRECQFELTITDTDDAMIEAGTMICHLH